jgi:glycosyltransferase involved in cell wall biosynthesis
MSESLTISAVVPMYNSAVFIERAISSIIQQSVRPNEIILVNDGSTDNGVEIIERTFPQVKIISINNSGEGPARNAGIEASSSTWIAFLDSDDFWLPTHLESVSKVIEQFAEASVIATGIQRWTPNTPLEIRQPLIEIGEVVYFEEQVNRWNVITSSSAVVKREAFDSSGFFKKLTMGTDIDMWERLALDHKFARTTEVTAVYVKNNSGASAKFGQKLAAYSEVSGEDLPLYRSKNVDVVRSRAEKKVLQMYQNQIRYASVTALLYHGQTNLAKKEARTSRGPAKIRVTLVLILVRYFPSIFLELIVITMKKITKLKKR